MVFRIPPALPANARTTYGIAAPISTHTRPATCGEVDCEAIEHGWFTRVDETTDLGRRQAHYIRHDSGRPHNESRAEDGITEFVFSPGLQCFVNHRIPLDRDPIFLVQHGDHRKTFGPARVHDSGDHWVEDMSGHLDTLDRATQ